MPTYVVSLAVSTDRQLSDEQAMQAARLWAQRADLTLGMTSTSRDEPWLRVQGMVSSALSPVARLAEAADELAGALRESGTRVAGWHAVELLDEDEVRRRSERPVIPSVYSAQQFADAAGLSRQRIHQYESDRKAGRRDDFPVSVLPGFWLQTEAEHWIRTRKTKPGPAPKTAPA